MVRVGWCEVHVMRVRSLAGWPLFVAMAFVGLGRWRSVAVATGRVVGPVRGRGGMDHAQVGLYPLYIPLTRYTPRGASFLIFPLIFQHPLLCAIL